MASSDDARQLEQNAVTSTKQPAPSIPQQQPDYTAPSSGSTSPLTSQQPTPNEKTQTSQQQATQLAQQHSNQLNNQLSNQLNSQLNNQQHSKNQNNQQQVTVEMETVPSVTTLGVNPNSTLRIKRSQDSVPRLSSTKGTGKRRSLRLAQGSKADIFAAKVANAVEEQDSSDDETFVYQAPVTSSHATDTLRMPNRRTTSNSSFQPPPTMASFNQTDGYFGDYVAPFESESEAGGNTHNESEEIPISPTRLKDGQSPRSFVIPRPVRALPQHQLPHQPYPSNLQPSSSSSLAPYSTPHDESMNYEEPSREFPWPRPGHSRHNSRSRVVSNGDVVSPIKDSNDSIRAKHQYLQRWRIPAASSNTQLNDDGTPEEMLDERVALLKGRPSLYNYQSSRNSYGRRKNHNSLTLNRQQQQQMQMNPQNRQFLPPRQNGGAGGNGGFNSRSPSNSQSFVGGGSEYSPADSTFKKFHSRASFSTRIMIGTMIFLITLLSVIFIGGVLLAAARPLHDFDVVALSDVLVSDRELVFSLITHAQNPGIFSRIVDHGELDVFATSAHANPDEDGSSNSFGEEKKTRTLLLGTIYRLESPMIFRGGVSSPVQWRSASAKLVNPMANSTALWSEISSYEFDLTIKGVINYNILGGEHKETVSRSYHVMSPKLSDAIAALL